MGKIFVIVVALLIENSFGMNWHWQIVPLVPVQVPSQISLSVPPQGSLQTSQAHTEEATRVVHRRHPFTKEEDQRLIALCAQYNCNWGKISQEMENRNPRQCRERWTHYLNPALDGSPWNAEDDLRLMTLVNKHGTNWRVINKKFPHRSSNNIKNRYAALIRQGKTTSPVVENSLSKIEIPVNTTPLAVALNNQPRNNPEPSIVSNPIFPPAENRQPVWQTRENPIASNYIEVQQLGTPVQEPEKMPAWMQDDPYFEPQPFAENPWEEMRKLFAQWGEELPPFPGSGDIEGPLW